MPKKITIELLRDAEYPELDIGGLSDVITTCEPIAPYVELGRTDRRMRVSMPDEGVYDMSKTVTPRLSTDMAVFYTGREILDPEAEGDNRHPSGFYSPFARLCVVSALGSNPPFTTMHELGHYYGVARDSPTEDEAGGHCVDESCAMYWRPKTKTRQRVEMRGVRRFLEKGNLAQPEYKDVLLDPVFCGVCEQRLGERAFQYAFYKDSPELAALIFRSSWSNVVQK